MLIYFCKILGKIIFVNAEGDASAALPGSKAGYMWLKKNARRTSWSWSYMKICVPADPQNL